VALLHQPLRQASFEHQFFRGPHNLTFVVEDVVPTDSNPSNNEVALASMCLRSPTSKCLDYPVDHAPRGGAEHHLPGGRAQCGATRGSAYVEVWDGEPAPGNGTRLIQEVVSLAPGQEERYYATWTPTPGEHRIAAIVVLAQPGENKPLEQPRRLRDRG